MPPTTKQNKVLPALIFFVAGILLLPVYSVNSLPPICLLLPTP